MKIFKIWVLRGRSQFRDFGAPICRFWGTRLIQRAENGALDPWPLNLRFWGAPIFSPEAPQTFFEGFRSDLGEKSGAPQTQIQ